MSKDTFLIQRIDKSYQITGFSVLNGKYSYAVKKTGVLLTVIIADCDIQSADDIQKIDDKIYPEKTDTLFKYNWIVGNKVEVNKKYKEILTDYISKRICVSHKKGISCFIGQLGMGDKELVSQSRTGNISIVHISLDADSSEIDKFGKKLIERAFDIHRFYAKEYNSRKSINEMKKEFRKTYTLTSSMRAALTIPYKMASVLGGSSAAFSREDIDMFCHTVYEENRNHILERLVCLEHKSWMIWLICDGWKLPMLDEIRKYAFVNGNDFKDRKNKFHPCLIESLEDVPMELEELTEKQWDDIEISNGIKDPLDRVSVKLYRYSRKRAKEICEKGELDEIIRKIKGYFDRNTAFDKEKRNVSSYVQNLDNSFRKMSEMEKNAVNLFLIYDGSRDENIEEEKNIYIKALKDLGLSHVKLTSVGLNMAIKKGMLKQVIENDYVDITGADSNLTAKIITMDAFGKCSFISIDGLEVNNLSVAKSEKYYYPVQKSLSVAETIELSGSYFFSETETNFMAAFSGDYEKIWSIFNEISLVYKDILPNLRWFIEMTDTYSRSRRRPLKFVKELDRKQKTEEKIYVSGSSKLISAYSIDKVLEEMRIDGYLINYVIPDGMNEYIKITTEYEEVKGHVEWMVSNMQKGRDHNFILCCNTYIKGESHPVTLIYDDACTLFLAVDDKNKADNKKYGPDKNKTYSDMYIASKSALENLGEKDKENHIIKDYSVTDKGIRVVFANKSVKRLLEREGNALEMFTYFSMRENKFDDIKLNVNVAWIRQVLPILTERM